jgi:tetratricopeptide (TPR) repeat protein
VRNWTVLVVAAVVAVYAASLFNELLAADLLLIDITADGYDPTQGGRLTRWWLAAQTVVFGLHPFGFRLTGLLLHAINSCLLLLVARQWTSSTTAGLAAVLFAVWPSGSQAVLSLPAHGVLLGTGLLLLGLYCTQIRGHRSLLALGLVATTVLALHATVQVAALPGLMLLGQRRRNARSLPPPSLMMHLLGYGSVVVWLLARLPAWSDSGAVVDILSNPLALLPTTQRVMIGLDQGWHYAQLLVMPMRLSADYGYGVINLSTTVGTGLQAGLLLALLGFALLRFIRLAELTMLGVLWVAATLLPVSNILLTGEAAFSEAYLYLPMVGFSLSLAACLSSWSLASLSWRTTGPMVRRVVVGLLLVFMCGRTLWRCTDWQNAERLWEHTVATQPNSARAYDALGTALYVRGAFVAAEARHRRGIGIYPRFATAHYNLGLSLYAQGKWAAALAAFERTCQLQPQRAAAHLNRGATLFRQGRWMPAADAYRLAAELRPAWPVPWLNLADALRAAGDAAAAAAAIEQAKQLGAVLPFE